MKFKTLLLSGAALFGSAGMFGPVDVSSAADLPVVEPDSYVRICDAFGAGFFYIPGSEMCLKIGGYVRAEAHYVDGDVGLFFGGADSDFNNYTSRARGNVHLDSMTQTDFGLIRTYVELQMSVGPSDFGADYSATDSEIPFAFVSVANDFGEFTAGHASSFFDFFGSYDYGTRIGNDDSTTEQTLFAYTLVGPNGIRGTISVEDPDSSGRRLNGTDDYEGQELPDLVGNIRVDREWGAAQVMGVVRDIHDVDGDGIGWAAGAGATLKLPIAGVEVSAQGGYSEGAIAYLTNDPGGIGDFSGPDGEDTNTAWMVRGGILAPLGATVTGWADGSFTHAEDEVNDDDYDFWAFAVGAAWAPNSAIAMGPEIAYNHIEGDDPDEDGEVWGAMWRVEASY